MYPPPPHFFGRGGWPVQTSPLPKKWGGYIPPSPPPPGIYRQCMREVGVSFAFSQFLADREIAILANPLEVPSSGPR